MPRSVAESGCHDHTPWFSTSLSLIVGSQLFLRSVGLLGDLHGAMISKCLSCWVDYCMLCSTFSWFGFSFTCTARAQRWSVLKSERSVRNYARMNPYALRLNAESRPLLRASPFYRQHCKVFAMEQLSAGISLVLHAGSWRLLSGHSLFSNGWHFFVSSHDMKVLSQDENT